ncbi:hypothetical protein DFS33DRAFT_1382345 [Desarmillaria ectypa]|nr:hypothetical protein DFS33DRAFT_1382345 [Desarmillaria ectypa]
MPSSKFTLNCNIKSLISKPQPLPNLSPDVPKVRVRCMHPDCDVVSDSLDATIGHFDRNHCDPLPPFVRCPYFGCGVVKRMPGYLRSHFRETKHLFETRIRCNACGRVFERRDQLNKHAQAMKGKCRDDKDSPKEEEEF